MEVHGPTLSVIARRFITGIHPRDRCRVTKEPFMRHRFGQTLLVAVTMTTLVAGATLGMTAGTGAAGRVARANVVTKIAIATPERAVDYGWNQQGVAAARYVAAYAGAKLVVDDGIGYDNVEPVLDQFATGGAKFIIAQASGYNTIAPRVAERYHVPIICYDDPQNLVKGLVSDIETSSQQGAYLAGVLAAKTTKTGIVGIVISAADPNWFKQSGGFIVGARSINKKIVIRFAQIGQAAYDDRAGGKRVASSVIASGADVIFGNGDGASFGYLAAAESARVGHKVWFIDVIGDKTPIDTHHVLLSSVLWDFRPIFKRAVDDINNGTYGTHIYNLDDSDGISLLKTPYISASLWRMIENDRKEIASGMIKIPVTATAAQVQAMLKA
jgi:basic membrane protein A